jgi:hypothetical protein
MADLAMGEIRLDHRAHDDARRADCSRVLDFLGTGVGPVVEALQGIDGRQLEPGVGDGGPELRRLRAIGKLATVNVVADFNGTHADLVAKTRKASSVISGEQARLRANRISTPS